MSVDEFYEIELGDNVIDKRDGNKGVVVVLSRGEAYVKFENHPNCVFCYVDYPCSEDEGSCEYLEKI